jgi:hypothetical protein
MFALNFDILYLILIFDQEEGTLEQSYTYLEGIWS